MTLEQLRTREKAARLWLHRCERRWGACRETEAALADWRLARRALDEAEAAR